MSKVRLTGATSGYTELTAPATAGNNTLTLPSSNGGANQLLKNSGTAGALEYASDVAVDSSGRLLVGTSSSTTSSRAIFQGASGDSSGQGIVRIALGSSTIADGNTLGMLAFTDSSHAIASSIIGQREGGTWTSGSSHPSRIVFNTSASGSVGGAERARITSTGYFKASNNGIYTDALSSAHELVNNANMPAIIARCTNGSLTDIVVDARADRTASNAFNFFRALSTNNTDNEFLLRGDGNALADGTWGGGGADYAEFFEWSDGNHEAEDRRGLSVVLDGEKIRPAEDGEDPIGVISGNPSVVGDAAWNKWSGKYLRDDFGTYILEDYEVQDEEGNTVIQQRRKLNPAYDPNTEYVSREERPEWDAVGLMGKLRIRKGQPTGARWIKMRDISATVEEWLVR